MGSRYNWTNSDGLVVNGGRRTSDNQAPGKLSTMGATQQVEFIVPESENESSAVQAYSVVLPAGAVVSEVFLFPDGALTNLADLTIGVADLDGGSTITDADGLVLAIDAAEVGALVGGKVSGTAFDGPLIVGNTPLTEAAVVTWATATASSAGNIRVVIEYSTAASL